MSKIVDEYSAKHPRSAKLYRASRNDFPDGVTHDGRYLTPFPVYMAEGAGACKIDVDGNRVIDFVMGHGALILGHAHPAIVDAVTRQVRRGTHLGANTELELRWAEKIKVLVPSVEKIRFHSSGTEAVSMAIRLARAFTGRSIIVEFDRHFHGWHDTVVPDPGKYSASGILPGTCDATLRIPPNDPSILEDTLRNNDVAAVIMEPTGGQMGIFPLAPGFVATVRELTAAHGALLLLDEVVTGFRVSRGGAQVLHGIQPDLSTFGKILGGGLPGAASAGRAEIMDMIAHRGDAAWNQTVRVGHPGTFNANPLSASAGIACLEIIERENINETADRLALMLKKGIHTILAAESVPGAAYGTSSIVKVVFGIAPPESESGLSAFHAGVASADPEITRLFKLSMLNNGVDTMSGSRFIVSAAHTETDIESACTAFRKSVIDERWAPQ